MSGFDWGEYVQRLVRKGYVVNLKRDSKNIVRGYTIGKGNSVYKSSQLGTGRNMMPSKIEQTWESLHPVERTATTKAVGIRRRRRRRKHPSRQVNRQTNR